MRNRRDYLIAFCLVTFLIVSDASPGLTSSVTACAANPACASQLGISIAGTSGTSAIVHVPATAAGTAAAAQQISNVGVVTAAAGAAAGAPFAIDYFLPSSVDLLRSGLSEASCTVPEVSCTGYSIYGILDGFDRTPYSAIHEQAPIPQIVPFGESGFTGQPRYYVNTPNGTIVFQSSPPTITPLNTPNWQLLTRDQQLAAAQSVNGRNALNRFYSSAQSVNSIQIQSGSAPAFEIDGDSHRPMSYPYPPNAPTPSPTPSPSPSPGDTPSPTPSPSPSSSPVPNPSPTPNPGAGGSPSPSPSGSPSPSPVPNPGTGGSPSPSPSPSVDPGTGGSPLPSPSPSSGDTPSPTPSPSPGDTPSPTPSPSPGDTPPTPEQINTDYEPITPAQFNRPNFVEYAKQKLADNFPMDVIGTMPGGDGSSGCPSYTFFSRTFELCFIRDAISALRIPAIIGFIIWCIVAL